RDGREGVLDLAEAADRGARGKGELAARVPAQELARNRTGGRKLGRDDRAGDDGRREVVRPLEVPEKPERVAQDRTAERHSPRSRARSRSARIEVVSLLGPVIVGVTNVRAPAEVVAS